MAIKERKQITGTTEQINAYAGHEGQIVWDKEKKTLVGMSGTAGENYPLAPKEYVDNEVAKVNTELTEGLAGKEDKGVCLPLSGGKLTGGLGLKFGGRLYQSKDPSNGYGYTVLTSKDDEDLNSCMIFLANPDSPDKGSIILRCLDGKGNPHDLSLQGESDGIFWNGRPVETLAGAGSNYVRYATGLQIVFARASASPNGSTITFGAPFASIPMAVATHRGTDRYVNITLLSSPTSLVARTNLDATVDVEAIIIGRWK